jgi:hypothetical protein
LRVRTKSRTGPAAHAGRRRPAVIEGEAVEVEDVEDHEKRREPRRTTTPWSPRDGTDR